MPNLYGLNRSLGIAISAIALVALISSGVVLTMMNHFIAVVDARGHSYEISGKIDDFRAAMLNQQTGLRGYLLTAQEAVWILIGPVRPRSTSPSAASRTHRG